MSLNAEDDAEFGPLDDTNGPTIITPPNGGASSNQVNAEDLFDAPVVAGQLPNFSGDIQMNEQRSNQLVDLADFRRTVSQQKCVSMEDASALDALQPGFINEDRPLALFTQEKTRTQYNETLQSINGFVDRNHEELKASVLDLSGRVLETARSVQTEFQCAHVTALTAMNRALVELLVATNARDVQYVRYTFNNKVRWSQFLQMDIYKLLGDGVVSSEQSAEPTGFEGTLLEPFLKRYQDILRDLDVRQNLDLLLNWNPEQPIEIRLQGNKYHVVDGLLQAVPREEGDADVCASDNKRETIGAFIEIVGDCRLRDFVKMLQGVYTNHLTVLAGIPAQVAELDGKTEQVLQDRVDQLVSLSSMVNRAHYQTTAVISVLCGIFQFMAVTKDLIDAITKTQVSVTAVQ